MRKGMIKKWNVIKLILISIILSIIITLIDINTIAGVSIIGIIIGFSVQSILTDALAFLFIKLEKPFIENDYITFDDKSGTVKKVHLRSTRIETLRGDELIISNSDLMKTRIHNYKKMKKRRIDYEIKISHTTSVIALKKVPRIVKTVFKNVKKADLIRIHLTNIGEDCFIFTTTYVVKTNDYDTYLDIQNNINFRMLQGFNKQGVKLKIPETIQRKN